MHHDWNWGKVLRDSCQKDGAGGIKFMTYTFSCPKCRTKRPTPKVKPWKKHTMDKRGGYWSMFYPDLIRTFPRQNSMLLRQGMDSTFHRSLVEFQMLGNICRTSAATSSSQRMSGWMGNARRHTGLFQHHENHNWTSDETVEVWSSKTWGTFWKQHSSTIGERALSKLKGATSK